MYTQIPVGLIWLTVRRGSISVENCPDEELGNLDYLVDMIDWETNTNPYFYENRFMAPKPVRDPQEMIEMGYFEEWICYKSELVSAKRLTVLPGREITIRDSAAYGIISLQGHGKFGAFELETPTLIRYGELTNDEYFVSESAAKEGVTIANNSDENMVLLKHFAYNPELPTL